MRKRLALLASPLLLLLLLAACGNPGTTPTSGSGGAAPSSSAPPSGTPVPNAPATPTLPAGAKPPRPAPDPAAVAAGAPLRATLLAQIDDFAREVANCQSIGTPIVSCNVTGYEAVRPHSPELAAYVGWYSFIKQCSADGKGGYIATMMFIYPSPDEIRDPALLDVYVSGTPGAARPAPMPRRQQFPLQPPPPRTPRPPRPLASARRAPRPIPPPSPPVPRCAPRCWR
jgi:hypothetical protein